MISFQCCQGEKVSESHELVCQKPEADYDSIASYDKSRFLDISEKVLEEESMSPGLKLDSDGTEVCGRIAKNLKPHQQDGICFMWKSCIKENDGCILAHSMGLGKTIQVVALIHTFTTQRLTYAKSGKCMVLTPCSLVGNWSDEFTKWIPSSERFRCFVLTTASKLAERIKILNEWYESESSSCLITSYETFCNLSELKDQALNLMQILLDGPDLAVFDEGHRLKNDKSRVGKILRKIKTKR